jgi:stage V sporulation protein G
MVITDVRVSPVERQRVLGFASVTLCECFVLRAMRIVDGNKRRYVAMPRRYSKEGQVFEVYHPIGKEARDTLERVIFDEYARQLRGETGAFERAVIGSECQDLRITSVKVRPFAEVKLRGFASIVIDDCIAVTGIKIIEGRKRAFLQMPNARKKSGKFFDLAFPISSEVRNLIEERIIQEYGRQQDDFGLEHYGS